MPLETISKTDGRHGSSRIICATFHEAACEVGDFAVDRGDPNERF